MSCNRSIDFRNVARDLLLSSLGLQIGKGWAFGAFRNPRQFPGQQRIATRQLGKIMARLTPALGENNPVAA